MKTQKQTVPSVSPVTASVAAFERAKLSTKPTKPVAVKPASKSATKPASKPVAVKPTKPAVAVKPVATTRKRATTPSELKAQNKRQHNAAKIAWLKIYADRRDAIPNTSSENKAKRKILADKLAELQREIKTNKIVSLAKSA